MMQTCRAPAWRRTLTMGLVSVLCAIMATGCIVETLRLDEAKRHKDQTVAQLLQLDQMAQFEHVKTVEYDRSFTAYRTTCYYATTYLAYGTEMPGEDALERFSQRIQTLGWTERTGPLEENSRAESRLFYRGEQEVLVVKITPPGFSVAMDLGYDELAKNYATVLIVSVDYILPQKEGC